MTVIPTVPTVPTVPMVYDDGWAGRLVADNPLSTGTDKEHHSKRLDPPVARPNRHYVPSRAKNDSQCGCQELGPSNSEGCASPSGIRRGGKDRSPVRQAVIRRRVLVFTGRRATRNATVARRKSAAIMRGSGSQNTGIRLRSGTSATTIVCTTTRKMTVG